MKVIIDMEMPKDCESCRLKSLIDISGHGYTEYTNGCMLGYIPESNSFNGPKFQSWEGRHENCKLGIMEERGDEMQDKEIRMGSVLRNGDGQISIILNRINDDFIYVIGYKDHHLLHTGTASDMIDFVVGDLDGNKYTINPVLGRCSIKNINSKPWLFIDANSLDHIKKYIIKSQENVLYFKPAEFVDPTPVIIT
jgi:hypothetical protein